MPSRTSCPAGILHPRIGREDPERRKQRADRDENGREHVQGRRHAVPAEKEDAEEGRLEEEGGQHLVADQRPDDIADDDRELAPVGAELIREDDPRDDAHGEGYREDARPEPGELAVARLAGAPPDDEERRDPGRKADREGREDDVERDREGELQTREKDGIEFHWPLPPRNRPCATRRQFRTG